MQIFVTGVSSGIGRELTRELLGRGHQVRGVARRKDALESLAREVSSPEFTYDVCDISDVGATAMLFEKMAGENYVPDIVVLNAAVDLEDTYPSVNFSQSCQMMRTNVDGNYYWISAFIEAFLLRGSGQFIAVSSIFAHWPDSASVSYSGSKAALSMIMRGLRLRYAGTRLQFKILYLGPVDTSINPRFVEQPQGESMIVASASDTASRIAELIHSERQNFFYPLFIFAIFAFLRWLPDKWFEYLTRRFKR